MKVFLVSPNYPYHVLTLPHTRTLHLSVVNIEFLNCQELTVRSHLNLVFCLRQSLMHPCDVVLTLKLHKYLLSASYVQGTFLMSGETVIMKEMLSCPCGVNSPVRDWVIFNRTLSPCQVLCLLHVISPSHDCDNSLRLFACILILHERRQAQRS